MIMAISKKVPSITNAVQIKKKSNISKMCLIKITGIVVALTYYSSRKKNQNA